MAKKDIYEIEEPLMLLDTKGVWRIELYKTTGKWIAEIGDYGEGDVVQFSTEKYVDADRAGFCGYLNRVVDIPVKVVLEAAEAIKKREVPLIHE